MKLIAKLSSIVILLLLSITPVNVKASGESYCDGYENGHRDGVNSFGMGYYGYPGCPGDPGSFGGNLSPYKRGYSAGLRDGTKEMCKKFPSHDNCR